MQQTEPGERTCERCGASAPAALVCPSCGSVQPVPGDADLFAVLGLLRGLLVDAADLEQRYHEASRLVHPDRHQTAGGRERELSLAASAAVNRAYRTLRDPVARGRYWLSLHGRDVAERDKKVPPVLVAEVFETQEALEAFRDATGAEAERRRGEVVALRDGLATRLDGLRDGLGAFYAGVAGANGAARELQDEFLDELRRRLSEIAYLRTLLGDIEDTIGDGLRGTHHRH